MGTLIMQSKPLLMKGLETTILLWVGSALLSLSLGMLMGITRSNRMRVFMLSTALDGITFVLRGIPFYVQLLIVYFALPDALGINVSPSLAGIISLGMCSAAYVSQMVRGGMNAIAAGQWEAAQVLGLNTYNTIRSIIA